MKKLFCLALLLLLCLFGCERDASDEESALLSREYSFYGKCEYNGCIYYGEFYISAGDDFSSRNRRIRLSSPEALDGFTVEYSQGETTYSYGDIVNESHSPGIAEIFELFNPEPFSERVVLTEGGELVGIFCGGISVTVEKHA